jgi:DNA-binding protein H-NS
MQWRAILRSYKELKAQMAELEKRAEAAREAELQSVVDEIRAKVVEYGITERDIFGARREGRRPRSRSSLPARYHDPKTGASWCGRGRMPNWIKSVKNREAFLIKDR